jgi:rfaE bifunctional protein kinase chain/domain
VIEVGQAVQKITGAKQVVLTRGKDGMTIFSGKKLTQVPTFARQVFDVTGAGDTVIAALALGMVSGLSLEQACMLANFAAGVVVGQVGCVPCTTQELKDYIEQTV